MIKLTVTSAKVLPPEIREKVESVFSAKLKKEITAEYLIDETLIGGIIVFDGERVYDGSVRSKLEKIRNEITK